MESEIDLQDLLQDLYQENRKTGFELTLALDACGFFYHGHKEDNAFHEGLYRTHNCERNQEEDIHIFCSQYLLDRENEHSAIETLEELRVFTKELQDNLKKEFSL